MKSWSHFLELKDISYQCGHCGHLAAPSRGYLSDHPRSMIYICPLCDNATYISQGGNHYPPVRLGNEVPGITDEHVKQAYDEARDCTTAGAYTGAVLLCRKILMNIAVQKGAQENQRFIEYVEFLVEKGYAPPNGKGWIDLIRDKGNDATHEIPCTGQEDAKLILHFTEMLLRFVYEMPSYLPK